MNMRPVINFASIAALLLFAGCGPFGCCEGDSKEASAMNDANLVVMNVLDEDMYNDCHIKGSVHVPFDQVESYAQKLNKDATVVAYCANYSCSASAMAFNMLKEAGFANARAYEGGMAEWYQKGLPYNGPGKLEYLQEKEEPIEAEDDVVSISAEELHELMQQEGLL